MGWSCSPPLYLLLEDTHLALTGPLAAAFAAWHGMLAAVLLPRHRDHALHFAALAFSLLSIAVALQFDGPAVTVGWAAEGAAIIALGLHERRDWLRIAGVALFTLAVVRTPGAARNAWPANHLVLLNPRAACAALVVGLSYLIAWLHRRDLGLPAGTSPLATGICDARGAAFLVAQLVTVSLLTSEIHAFFAVRDEPVHARDDDLGHLGRLRDGADRGRALPAVRADPLLRDRRCSRSRF